MDDLIRWFPVVEKSLGEMRHKGTGTRPRALAHLFERGVLPDPELEYRTAKLLVEAGEPVPVPRMARRRPQAEAEPPAPAHAGVSILSVIGSSASGTTARAREVAVARQSDLIVEVSLNGGLSPQSAKAPEDALADALRILAVPASDIGPTLEARRDRYIAAISGKSIVVLLTDAVSANQVKPFVPSSEGTLIVTAERELRSLPVTRQIRLETVETPPLRSLTTEEDLIVRLAGLLRVRELDLMTAALGIGRSAEQTEAALRSLVRRGIADFPVEPSRRWSIRDVSITAVALRELGELRPVIAAHTRRCRSLSDLLESPALNEQPDVGGWAYGRWTIERELFTGTLCAASGGYSSAGAEPRGAERPEPIIEQPFIRGMARLARAYVHARTVTRDWSRPTGWRKEIGTVARAAGEPQLEDSVLLELGLHAKRSKHPAAATRLLTAAAEATDTETRTIAREALAGLPRTGHLGRSAPAPALTGKGGLGRVTDAIRLTTGATVSTTPGMLFGTPGNPR